MATEIFPSHNVDIVNIWEIVDDDCDDFGAIYSIPCMHKDENRIKFRAIVINNLTHLLDPTNPNFESHLDEIYKVYIPQWIKNLQNW